MKRYTALLLIALLAVLAGQASSVPDDDDKVPAMQQGIRRLHPERERAKALKRLQEEMSRKVEQKADPWDTSDEVWGTVDLPPAAVRDSAAVEGHRLTSAPDAPTEGRRMTWRDEPVTADLDQLMPFMTVEGGEYHSKYVSADSVGNEVYFAFTMDGEDALPGPLRLCVRYSASSPLDYDQVIFTIDGYDYFFYPKLTRQGKAEGGLYWSASDDELQAAYKDLVYALCHGNWVMVKLMGTGGVSRVRVLTDNQLDDFANTLAVYRLLGGII